MNTKKINTINWWSDDAVTSQSENTSVNQTFPEGQNGLYGNSYGANYPMNNSGSLPPLIQPLVVVPYSTTMQPLDPTSTGKGSGKYYEDMYDDEENEVVGENKKAKKSVPATSVGGLKKRTGAFIALTVFAVLITVVTLIGAFVSAVNEYIALFVFDKNTFIAVIEPVIGFLSSKIGGLDALSIPDNFTALTVGQEGFAAVSATILPIAIALYVVFSICSLIASIIGLCRKKASKSNKFALLVFAILMFLFAVVSAIMGLFAVGMGMSNIMGFLTGSGDFVAGYGLYIMIAIPIAMIICSCCVYGKNKKSQ